MSDPDLCPDDPDDDVGGPETPRHHIARLAHLLAVPEPVLIEQIGGPWRELTFRELEDSTGDPVFLGRGGNSALVTIDGAGGLVTVGEAIGEWSDPGTLLWRAAEPTTTVGLAGSWLGRMATAVDAACEAKRDSLVTCRFCGTLTGPEFAFGDDCCSSCASTYRQLVF